MSVSQLRMSNSCALSTKNRVCHGWSRCNSIYILLLCLVYKSPAHQLQAWQTRFLCRDLRILWNRLRYKIFLFVALMITKADSTVRQVSSFCSPEECFPHFTVKSMGKNKKLMSVLPSKSIKNKLRLGEKELFFPNIRVPFLLWGLNNVTIIIWKVFFD